jgi:hypothetical protein
MALMQSLKKKKKKKKKREKKRDYQQLRGWGGGTILIKY